jgi:hypothetical protein
MVLVAALGGVQRAQAQSAMTQPASVRHANVAVRPVADAVGASVDLAALRGQLQQFSDYLNRNLQAAFVDPFGLLQDVKGIYLPGYGVAFHMEANLIVMRTLNPFDMRPYTEEELRQTRQAKLERIQRLKEQVNQLLWERGTELSAIPTAQHVAVAIHLFNMPSERTEGLPTQVVVAVSRSELLEAKARNLTAEQFRKQVTFLEF